MQTSKRHTKKRNAACILAILLVALIIGAYLFVRSPTYDANAGSIQYANANETEIQKQLNQKTEASRLWISVAHTTFMKANSLALSATSSDGSAIPVLNNLADNTRDVAYTLLLEDGSKIYQSDLIKPGQSILAPELTQRPSSGVHTVTAQAQGYDPDTHEKRGGVVEAQFQLTVE